jgi:hypothetical protein
MPTGLGYREYTSDEKVFSCPSFVLKDMAELVYSDRANYKPTRTDLQRASGYGLNSFFFRDLDASSTDPMRYNRKVGSLRSPRRFIVTHDHMEPKLEGDSTSGGEQNDMFYIPAGGTYTLLHYRTGDRKPYYGGSSGIAKSARPGTSRPIWPHASLRWTNPPTAMSTFCSLTAARTNSARPPARTSRTACTGAPAGKPATQVSLRSVNLPPLLSVLRLPLQSPNESVGQDVTCLTKLRD